MLLKPFNIRSVVDGATALVVVEPSVVLINDVILGIVVTRPGCDDETIVSVSTGLVVNEASTDAELCGCSFRGELSIRSITNV